MMPTELAKERRGDAAAVLRAAEIARLCRGRVIRTGDGARRITTDSRDMAPGDCFVALCGDRMDGHDYIRDALAAGAAGVVVSRSVPRTAIPDGTFVVRVPDTLAALQELATAHRVQHAAKVVGITGSCGKTSTKEMLGSVLSAAMPTVRSPKSFNNHIGVPLTLFLLQPETRAAVVEIGTSEPGEIARLTGIARPDIGIVTCVAEAHLAGLGSLAGVAREKASLVAGLAESGLAILNGDDASCRAMAEVTRARVVRVRLDREADWFATDAEFGGMGTTFLLQGERPVTLPLLGTHNVYNALFTIAAAVELGMELAAVLTALARLPVTSRRLEPKVAGDVTIFDDTYNMNPASARAGLLALAGLGGEGRKIAVLGEMLELGERTEELHRELGREVVAAGIDLLVTVGAKAEAIADGARAAKMGARRIRRCDDTTTALEVVGRLVRPGDQLLCKASRRVGLDRLVDGLLERLR